MEKETIMARLTKGGFVKKDGTIKSKVVNDLMYYLIILSHGRRVHPLYWNGTFHSLCGFSKYEDMCNLLKVLKVCFIEGNDAPRGGICGKFIEVNNKHLKKLKEIIKIISTN